MKTIILIILSFINLAVNSQEIKPDTHYKILDQQTKSQTPEIYEFFGYTCPGCNSFEPHLEAFEKANSQIKVTRVPVIFHESWKPFAQAYYTAETMGILDKVHKPIFNAIHRQKKGLRTLDQIADFLQNSLNIDKQKFLATSKSFTVDSKVRKAQQLTRKLGVANTPTLVINNKYLTSPSMIPKGQKSYNFFIKVIEFLTTLN